MVEHTDHCIDNLRQVSLQVLFLLRTASN
jgi:hypothetical protein